MSIQGQESQPLIGPVTAHGLHIEPAAGRVDEVTESSALLVKKPVERPSEKAVHYRNIDGTRFWILFGSIIFGNTIAFFDTMLMASSHPVITSYFHSSNSASWLSTVFYLTSTVSQPLYGRISDTWGRRPVYVFAALMFFLSTAWCALSRDIGEFIAARAVCGLGAGGVMSVSNIITSDIVKIEFRGIYQSYYNMSYGVGNGLGACFGGLLCDKLGWRWAFGIQLPFIFVFICLSWLTTPPTLGPNLAASNGKSIGEAFRTFDSLGAIVLTTTITSLILGINLGGNVLSWTSPFVIIALVVAFAGCVALPRVSRRAARPILPLPLLTTPPTSNMMWAQFFFSICNNAVLFNVPLYLQAVRQTTPTVSGLYLISPLVGVSLTAIFTGYYITYTRRMKPTLVIGTFCLLAGAIGTTSLGPNMPLWTVLLLIPGTALGQGFFFPTVTIATLALNSQDEQAVVVTTSGLSRSMGSIMGVAISSWVLQNSLPFFLEKEVDPGTPELKRKIIQEVRKSVRAINSLDPTSKSQVIKAYSEALRITFAVGIIWALVVAILALPTKLPKLQSQEDKDRVEDEEEENSERARRREQRRRLGLRLGGHTDDDDMEGDEEALLSEDTDEEEEDGRFSRLSRQTSHIQAVQLGRRASHDTAF